MNLLALPPIPQEEVVSEEDINDINEDVEVEDDEVLLDDEETWMTSTKMY